MRQSFWIISVFILSVIASAMVAAAGENLALGKKYTLAPAPNYEHCTDNNDDAQLTDGVTTDQYFWTQKGTVGWNRAASVEVTVDLEKVCPIDSVAFNSAAGVAGVSWPKLACAMVSEDGNTWYMVGDLMTLDTAENGPLDTTKYSLRKILAADLATKGRFVKLFLQPSGSFIFIDEIEIGRGDDALLIEPIRGEKIDSIAKWFDKIALASQIQRRYAADIAAVAALIEERQNAENDSTKKVQLAELDEQLKKIAPDENFLATIDPNTFRTVFPFDAVHAGIFAIQAAYWRLCGETTPLAVQRVEPLDFVQPTGELPTDSEINEPLVLARNDWKSAAFMLRNTTEQPMEVTVSLEGDFAMDSENVTCCDVPWTDTAQLIPVAAALLEAKKTGTHCWTVTVLPGLPKQVWFDIDSANIPAGDYVGAVSFAAQNISTVNIPMTLSVKNLLLPAHKSLLLGGWDYTNGGGSYNVNAKNLESFIATAKAFGVNAPWANPAVMFSGVTCEKSEDGCAVSLDPKQMDEWLALWPNAKEYYIFISVQKSFFDIPYDADGFSDAVAAWASAWGKYFDEKNISPERVFLLVFDEPGMKSTMDIGPMLAWSKAIKAGEKRFQIWEDPLYYPPSTLPEELIDVCNVICPNRPQWISHRSELEPVYRAVRDRGKRLDFYSCSGPVRLLDPYNYFRLQAWHIFAERGGTSFFWALGDGAGVNCWNEYQLSRDGYCPMFIDPNDAQVTPAKQLAAMRQSSYDFELLTLLRDFAEKNADNEKGARAKTLLDERLNAVLWAEGCEKMSWFAEKDRTAADQLRTEMIELLAQ